MDLIARSYENYRCQLMHYIGYYITDKDDTEDLVQDVFLRLMDCRQMLREKTVRFFIFTIARHLLIDYLRRHYKEQEITSYLYNQTESFVNDVENCVVADDLRNRELKKVEQMPSQRRKVYCMSRFEGRSVVDISMSLKLSPRTVENHLFLGRKEVREYMRDCV